MESLESELDRARSLSVEELADAIESIGFECTRCGGCCTGEDDDPHTATVFPDEVRDLGQATGEAATGEVGSGEGDERAGGHGDDEPDVEYDWRDVARPMPYGLSAGEDGPQGETFEWALQTDACGDCVFYEEREDGSATDAPGGDDGTDADGPGHCTVHEDRPLICRTYPFSIALGGTTQPMGEAVDEAGMVRAHECEGLGRDVDRADALQLAEALKERAISELEEAIAVADRYEPADPGPGEVVVHDSEGRKRPDGSRIE